MTLDGSISRNVDEPAVGEVDVVGRVQLNGFRVLGHSSRIVLLLEGLIALAVHGVNT